MSSNSSIEWTGSTWNPLTGCTKISPGCKNCYAERMSLRLRAMGQTNYRNGFRVTTHNGALGIPLQWKRPQTVFVNSMSDLFHEEVPTEFVLKVFEVMKKAPWHTFQLLTKRSQRLMELSTRLPWLPHIWMGVSVESQDYAFRIDDLRKTGAQVKFVSFEPLLGAVSELSLDGLDWVIVGGESGPGARQMDPGWVMDIRDQCQAEMIPFFFKQWGGFNRKKTGRQLDGRIWNELPALTR